MKKFILLTVVAALPIGMMAQDDDMYFVPTKENVAKEAKAYGMPKDTYYAGSQRSVDDYNRKAWSSVAPVDSAGNDIVDFSAVRGVYPESDYSEEADNDYQYTRRMSRFDGYTSVSDAYWEGYRDGRWMSPWYYSSYYNWYDPWYWDSPWYYGYYGWYSPWHYGWYHPWHSGWYHPWGYYPWYGGGGSYRPSGSGRFHVAHRLASGSHIYSNGNRSTYRNGSFGNGSTMNRGNSVNSSRNNNTNNSFSNSSRSSSFGGSRNSGGSFSGGGGSRSSGGGAGGGSRSGGGSFGRGR